MLLVILHLLLLFFRNTAFESQIQAKNGPNIQEKAVNTGPVISSANEKIWPIYGKKYFKRNIYF